MDCLFCKIAAGGIPSKKLYEDDHIVAFYDNEPKTPVHFLVIPKTHNQSGSAVTPENHPVVAHIFEVIAKLAAELDLKNGYRVVSNCGDDAGQTVHHLHFHVLAGRKLYPDMA